MIQKRLAPIVTLFFVLSVTLAAFAAETVYITPKGKKYHRESCRTIKNSSTPISLNDAIARGYTSCKVCGPPSK